jgi:hypothetical protein
MALEPTPLHRSLTMAFPRAARSRNDDGSRPRAATRQRPSGRSRPQRIDPSTITSPTARSCTQISPGVRGRIGSSPTRPTRNHSPPLDSAALLQISRHRRHRLSRRSILVRKRSGAGALARAHVPQLRGRRAARTARVTTARACAHEEPPRGALMPELLPARAVGHEFATHLTARGPRGRIRATISFSGRIGLTGA